MFIVFNMAFTAFDTSMTAVMKSLHLDSVLGVQLAMLAVGSCMGALVFGSRELKGSRWRHMIMFLALMTVGFVVIHLCQGNLIVMGLVEILTGLTISPVFASGNLVVKETCRGIAHRRPVLGEHRRHDGRVVRLHDHRHRARPFQSKRGIEPARRVRGLFDSVRADWLAAGAPPRLTDVRSSSVIAACLRVEASL